MSLRLKSYQRGSSRCTGSSIRLQFDWKENEPRKKHATRVTVMGLRLSNRDLLIRRLSRQNA